MDEWNLGRGRAPTAKMNSVKNIETLHGFGQYNHLFSERWFGYVRADALARRHRGCGLPVHVQPGAGYYFIKDKDTTLAGEVGPAFCMKNWTAKTTLTRRCGWPSALSTNSTITRASGRTWNSCRRSDKSRQFSRQRRNRRGSRAHQTLEPANLSCRTITTTSPRRDARKTT